METVNHISGMVAVLDNYALNARLGYEIDLATNRVRYILRTLWKPLTGRRTRPIRGEVAFADYKEAQGIFEGLELVAQEDIRSLREVSA